jgi:NodT family efflux transporter outer membrane factor (OMF) lipoprotein
MRIDGEVSMIRAVRLGVTAAFAAVLAGCMVGPNYKAPDLAPGSSFHNGPAVEARAAKVAPIETWWTGFNDPQLSQAIERALAQNLDLAQARARVLQSRAVTKMAGAALYPKAEVQSSAADVRQSLLSPFGAVGSHVSGFERDYDLYDVGAAASWEIDLFGGLRRAHQAAQADAQATTDELASLRISVAAETADAYLRVRADQARLDVAHRQEAVEQRLVALLVQRKAQGVASDREVRQGQAALEGVRASIPPLLAGKEAQLNRLDILMGAVAGTYAQSLRVDAPLPSPPGLSAADGPADLLRRRPDILAAERHLAASNARIGAAIADYYPKISIIGLLGVESLDSRQMFVGDAVQHQLSGGLRWRLFDFGRIDAEVAEARGRDAEALAAYRATVLRATGEVETAYSDLVQNEAEIGALQRQIAQLTQARAQAQQAYDGGAISLIEVLDADRDLLTAADKLTLAQAGASRAAVSAFRALGGGWKTSRILPY